ncbi:MAG: ABC transporter substrate-binding protein [Deltaproteobacteria bacterium]|nr:ABC transporter substrate-binding protein [Deltaproteobacteria bacterium]
MKNLVKRAIRKQPAFCLLTSIVLLLAFSLPLGARESATPKFEKINVIMIGGRLIDVTYHLGFIPEAISACCSSYVGNEIKAQTHHIGCPGKLIQNQADKLEKISKKSGINQIFLEKNLKSCSVDNISKTISKVLNQTDNHYTIKYVDFSQGLESATRQVAKLLGCRENGETLIRSYRKKITGIKKELPQISRGKKVIIVHGIYQKTTGKTFLMVEAPGGYSDEFMLKPLGCVNVADVFKSEKTKTRHGRFMIRNLDALAEAQPDAIVMLGDAFAVQKAIEKNIKKNPNLFQKVPAIKKMAFYSLPAYTDFSIFEYPAVLKQWVEALAD